MALTVHKLARLKEPGRYLDERGLYLQVTETGVRSWIFRYARDGRERWLGLGPLHTVDLKTARERARQARLQLLNGIDPLDARKAARAEKVLEAAKTLTFEEAAKDWFATHERKWSNEKHRAQIKGDLRRLAFPKIGRVPVAALDTGLVLKVVEPVWRRTPETASRLRGRIENILDWATVRGYRSGENPARWRGHLDQVLPARSQIAKPNHHAALPFAELPAFMAALRAREGIAAMALEFLLLTAARTGEVLGATWDEIDLHEKQWTIPAARMKAGKEHRVPLSDRALKLLKGLPREKGNPFVFIGAQKGSGLSNMAMATLLRRMGRDDITVHGFRSTFRDWAAERTAYPNHVVEMALAHVIGDKVEKAYRRGDLFDKRRRLMADWARFAETPRPESASVTSIRAGSA
ncbi:MAG TPA: integrase arm-type DNA-binding domain-containing protein [Methyloceanibacter sp.]|jgi:integrase|nr:integrase arm-type DNA-binding domain-containing protein [Methyloceanibacter sp.]